MNYIVRIVICMIESTILLGAVPAIEQSSEIALVEQQRALVEAEWLADDVRFSKTKTEMTTVVDALGAVDGNITEDYGFHTASEETDAWWQVDLGSVQRLDRIVVYNRTDGGTAPRTRNINVLVSKDGLEFEMVYQHLGPTFYGTKEGKPLIVKFDANPVDARFVRLMVPGKCSFALVEVEVYAADAPDTNIALGKPADQKSISEWSKAPATEMALPQDKQFTLAHTADVLKRAATLATRLEIVDATQQLAVLQQHLQAMQQNGQTPELDMRRELYLNARRVLRDIAFRNPLLQDIGRLLFVKRHDASGCFHMCDQFYGFNAVPGGGIYVLENPFGGKQRLYNLLKDAVVEKGRLAGQKLEGGCFVSPELTFDA